MNSPVLSVPTSGTWSHCHRMGDLAAQRVEGDQGVGLSYEIEAWPRTTVDVTGYVLSRATIRSLETAWTQSVLDDFLVDEAATIVRRALAEDGYLQPEVAATVAANGVKRLRITIAPGARTSERRIVIESRDAALARELERWLTEQRLEETAWREPGTVERELANHLRTRGHLNAEVTAAAARLEGRTAILTLTVNAGPVFTIGDVRFVNASGLDAEACASALARIDPALLATNGPLDVDRAMCSMGAWAGNDRAVSVAAGSSPTRTSGFVSEPAQQRRAR